MELDCWRVAHHSHSREQSSTPKTTISLMPTNYCTTRVRLIKEVPSLMYIRLPYTW